MRWHGTSVRRVEHRTEDGRVWYSVLCDLVPDLELFPFMVGYPLCHIDIPVADLPARAATIINGGGSFRFVWDIQGDREHWDWKL